MTDNSAQYDLSQLLRDGLREVGWLPADLWIASVALGGSLDLRDVTNIASGRRNPSSGEYDLLAAALNEEFSELGRDHPMDYWHDLIANS